MKLHVIKLSAQTVTLRNSLIIHSYKFSFYFTRTGLYKGAEACRAQWLKKLLNYLTSRSCERANMCERLNQKSHIWSCSHLWTKRVGVCFQHRFDSWQWCRLIKTSRAINWKTQCSVSVFRGPGGGRKVLNVPQKAGGRSAQRREANEPICLSVCRGNGSSFLPPHTVIWEPGSHKHMFNDSIYSPGLHISIPASLSSL